MTGGNITGFGVSLDRSPRKLEASMKAVAGGNITGFGVSPSFVGSPARSALATSH